MTEEELRNDDIEHGDSAKGAGPCPFCGEGNPHWSREPVGMLFVYVRCRNCGGAGGEATRPADALAAWNQRAATPPYTDHRSKVSPQEFLAAHFGVKP